MKLWITGRANVAQVYSDVRDFLKQGYELVKPRKPKKKPGMVTTGDIFGQRRKKRWEILTTADVNLKERPNGKTDMISTDDLEEKEIPGEEEKGIQYKLMPDYLERRKQREAAAKKKEAEPFRWAK